MKKGGFTTKARRTRRKNFTREAREKLAFFVSFVSSWFKRSFFLSER